VVGKMDVVENNSESEYKYLAFALFLFVQHDILVGNDE
jgi:hypothetical protein